MVPTPVTPMQVESTPVASTSRGSRNTSRGAIPKERRAESQEARESRRAQEELEEYLTGTGKQTQRVQPLKAGEPPLRILPVISEPTIFMEENWDDEPTSEPPRPAPVATTRWQPASTSRREEPQVQPSQFSRRRKDPSRRQWTVDDYVSPNLITPPHSPLPGPANLVSREPARTSGNRWEWANTEQSRQEPAREREHIRGSRRQNQGRDESIYPV